MTVIRNRIAMQAKVIFSVLFLLCVKLRYCPAEDGCRNGGLLEIKDVVQEFLWRKHITLVTIYYCKNG